MELYEREKLESMNYIFGKLENNNKFTEFELKAISNIDLFDRKVVNICKIIWENRNNDEKIEEILEMLKEAENNGNTSISNSEKVAVENQQA